MDRNTPTDTLRAQLRAAFEEIDRRCQSMLYCGTLFGDHEIWVIFVTEREYLIIHSTVHMDRRPTDELIIVPKDGYQEWFDRTKRVSGPLEARDVPFQTILWYRCSTATLLMSALEGN